MAQSWTRALLAGHCVPVPYFEGTLWVDVGHRMERWIFNSGVYERGTIDLIRFACANGYSFVDVGAGFGSHIVAACLARRNAHQKFVALEPEPETLKILRWNLARNHLNSMVDLIPLAASDQSKAMPFYVTRGDHPGINGLARREPDQKCIPIQARRLDEMLGGDLPDKLLLKIDVEGLEPAVLDGASGLLASARNMVLIIEHAPENLARAGFRPNAVAERLVARGFRLWKINEDTAQLESFDPEVETFCNFFAARELPFFLAARLKSSQRP